MKTPTLNNASTALSTPREIQALMLEVWGHLQAKFGFKAPLPMWTMCGRLSAALGRAKGATQIKYNKKSWPELPQRIRREIIIHELCHSACAAKYRTRKGHGPEWVEMMVYMGEKARLVVDDKDVPCHTKKKQRRVYYQCHCPSHRQNDRHVSMRLYNQIIRKGEVRRCLACDGRVRFDAPVRIFQP